MVLETGNSLVSVIRSYPRIVPDMNPRRRDRLDRDIDAGVIHEFPSAGFA
jgi:hypothetical protein